MNIATVFIGALGRLLHPTPASADFTIATTVVNAVGGSLASFVNFTAFCSNPANPGGCLAETVVVRLQWLILPIATLIIVITGIRMIVAQEDDSVEKSKAVMSACIAGIVMVFLTRVFVSAFYTNVLTTGPAIIEDEVGGLISWALVLVAPLAITMIVVTGVKALTKPDEGIANIRKTILSVIAGLLLIVFRLILVIALGGKPRSTIIFGRSVAIYGEGGPPAPLTLLGTVLDVLVKVLAFGALGAAVVVIYAGIMMVLSFGREEQFTKSKSLIIRSLVGLIIVLLSAAIIQFVLIASLS